MGQSILRALSGQVLAPRRCEGRRGGRPSAEPAAPRPAPPCPGCSRFAAQLSTPVGANFSLCHYFGLHVSPGLSRLGSSPPSTTPTLLLWPASCLTTPSSPSSSPIPPFRICAQQRPETRRGDDPAQAGWKLESRKGLSQGQQRGWFLQACTCGGDLMGRP